VRRGRGIRGGLVVECFGWFGLVLRVGIIKEGSGNKEVRVDDKDGGNWEYERE